MTTISLFIFKVSDGAILRTLQCSNDDETITANVHEGEGAIEVPADGTVSAATHRVDPVTLAFIPVEPTDG